MKQKVVLFGNNSFTDLVRYFIEAESEYEISGYFVDRNYLLGSNFCNRPIVSTEDLILAFPPQEHKIALSIGYRGMNRLRNRIYFELKTLGYSFATFISPSAKIYTNDIGEGNLIFSNVTIEPYSQVGIGNIIRSNAYISHNAVLGNFNYISPSACIAGNVKIGDNTFIGANSTIRNSLTIGDFSLIGAGCFLSRNSNNNEVHVAPKSVKLEKNSDEIEI